MARLFNCLMCYKSPLNGGYIYFPIISVSSTSFVYSRDIHTSACHNRQDNDQRSRNTFSRHELFDQKRIFTRHLELPISCLQRQSPNEHKLEAMLLSHLEENNIEEANKVLYDCLRTESSLPKSVIRYCLLKNAESGNISFFEDLTSKFDAHTKMQLDFYKSECKAYAAAGRSQEYLRLIRDAITKNSDNLERLAGSFSPVIIDMIAKTPDIYDNYVSLAKDFSHHDLIEPICNVWIYNFIYDQNATDNDTIWNEYLQCHPTIVCEQVTKILYKSKEIGKLRQFLNSEKLPKQNIATSILGVAYSNLLSGLLDKKDYDAVIDELQNALEFLQLKDFRPNTLNKIKSRSPSPEYSQQFWSLINNKSKVIQK